VGVSQGLDAASRGAELGSEGYWRLQEMAVV
jgi:hypothetical protein